MTLSSAHVSQAPQEIKDILKETCAIEDMEPDTPFLEATVVSFVPIKHQVEAHQESSKNFLISVRQKMANLELNTFEKVIVF